MASEQSTQADVYEGFWTNYAYGRVGGATLTLDRQRGAVLIAFLALYVGLAGQGCWRISRFYLHRVFSSFVNPDGIYNQRQAILRNSETSLAAALAFVQTNIAWRKQHVERTQTRLLPVTVLSLSLSLAFAAAGILSSRVTSNGLSEVLLSGSACGAPQPARDWNSDDYDYDPLTTTYHARKFTEYLTYALQCYRNDRGSNSEKCQSYIKPSLNYTKKVNAACPYAAELCIDQSSNLVLDTGYLKSEGDLGINADPSFSLRQVRHCAPLKTEGFSEIYTNSNISADQSYVRYNYFMDEDATSYEPVNTGLFTWQVPTPKNLSAQGYLMYTTQQAAGAYKFGVVSESALDRTGQILMPSKGNLDAKVSLIFLDSSEIVYRTPTTDPWFAATRPLVDKGNGDAGYLADQPASVIACTTRVTICKPDSHGVGDCISAFDEQGLSSTLKTIWSDTKQAAAVEGAIWYINRGRVFDSDIFYQTSGLPTLMTQWSIDGVVQTDNITSDKWQAEMEYAFQASLSSIQAASVELASGSLQWEYLNEGPQQSVCNPPDPDSACRTVCQNQKVRSQRYYSFSVVGICIILCLGGLLIIVGYWIEWITSLAEKWLCVGKRRSRKHNSLLMNTEGSSQAYSRAEWNATSTLQLQRLAHEALGATTWSRTNEAVPITKNGEKLGVLDISDAYHPVLRHNPTFESTDRDDREELPRKRDPQVVVHRTVTEDESWQSSHASDQMSFLPKHDRSERHVHGDDESFQSNQRRDQQHETYAMHQLT